VIGFAMAKSPGARYATADAMRRDLLRVARGEAIVGAHGGAGDDDPTRMMGAAAAGAAAGAALGGRRGPSDVDTTTVMPAVDGAAGSGLAGAGAGAGGYSVVDPNEAKKNNKVWIWVVVAVLVLAAGVALAWYMGLFGPNEDVFTMPKVTEMLLDDALNKLQEEGVASADPTLITVEEAFSSTIAAGYVISQDPEAGDDLIDPLPADTPVTLVVSKGERLFDVPKLIGKTFEEAQDLLEEGEAEFKLDPTEEYSDSVEVGTIVSQEPEPKTELPGGSAIRVVVSRGVESAGVPDVTGLTQNRAVTNIEEAGFKARIKEVFSDDVRAGVVIDQNPRKGTSLPKGGNVEIIVSKGSDQVTVPNVLNFSEETAIDRLQAANLVARVRNVPGELGIVVAQTPTAGTKAAKGSTVTISVGNTP